MPRAVIFGNQPAHAAGQQFQGATFTLAAILTFSVIGACYTNIAIGVTFARESGVEWPGFCGDRV